MKTAVVYTKCILGLLLVTAMAGAQTPDHAESSSSRRAHQLDIPISKSPEEPPDEELEPAAVQLDVSHESPLIQVLYGATRETEEQLILDRLAEANKLIDGNADLKAVDANGRTALHWAIFGSS